MLYQLSRNRQLSNKQLVLPSIKSMHPLAPSTNMISVKDKYRTSRNAAEHFKSDKGPFSYRAKNNSSLPRPIIEEVTKEHFFAMHTKSDGKSNFASSTNKRKKPSLTLASEFSIPAGCKVLCFCQKDSLD
jgi:hypothetical protein